MSFTFVWKFVDVTRFSPELLYICLMKESSVSKNEFLDWSEDFSELLLEVSESSEFSLCGTLIYLFKLNVSNIYISTFLVVITSSLAFAGFLNTTVLEDGKLFSFASSKSDDLWKLFLWGEIENEEKFELFAIGVLKQK